MKHTILLVEDNAHIMAINFATLSEAGFRVLKATSLAGASQIIDAHDIDLIVLDIMLPDGDGIAFCLQLRADNIDIPVLFLTAKGDKDDILEGLRAGGDDYLTKPYNLEIFLARAETLLRRTALRAEQTSFVKVGDITLDIFSQRAMRNGTDLLLTPKEFSLLNKLSKNQDHYTTSNDLYKEVWGMDTSSDTGTVKERIFQLRRKLGDDSIVQIENARGKGYRLRIGYDMSEQ